MILVKVSTKIVLFGEKIEPTVLEGDLQKSMQAYPCRLYFAQKGINMGNDN